MANAHGLDLLPGSAAAQNELTTTYRARSSYTSWGTHNMFSVATTGGTTSEATPTVGGVMAMVLAYGKQAAGQGLIERPLTPSEAIQVVRETTSDIAENPNPPNGWPAGEGWDLQFGYGRPNVLAAMQAIERGDIPPEAWIDGPRWYSLYDPAKTRRINVRGHAAAPRSQGYRYVLEYAPGPEPTDADFIPAGKGKGKRSFDGTLGTIDLSRIPKSFWEKAFALSQTKTLETNDQYTVTIRLRVFDRSGRMAEERRAIAVHHDPSLRRGFPRFVGAAGESQPRARRPPRSRQARDDLRRCRRPCARAGAKRLGAARFPRPHEGDEGRAIPSGDRSGSRTDRGERRGGGPAPQRASVDRGHLDNGARLRLQRPRKARARLAEEAQRWRLRPSDPEAGPAVHPPGDDGGLRASGPCGSGGRRQARDRPGRLGRPYPRLATQRGEAAGVARQGHAPGGHCDPRRDGRDQRPEARALADAR